MEHEVDDGTGSVRVYKDVTPACDGGVLKRVIKPGDAQIGKPPLGQVVKIHFDGYFVGGRKSGQKFDTSRGKLDDFEREDFYRFRLGEAYEAIRDGWTIRGFTIAVESMNRGEIAEFILEPEYGYGEMGNASRPKVHKNAKLRYVIQLFAWRRAYSDKLRLDEMSMEERIAMAIETKDEATSYYRDDQYHEALERYNHAAALVHEYGFVPPEGREAECTGIVISCLLNEAHCFNKLGQYRKALMPCEQVLDEYGEVAKAYYRRATAYLGLHEFESAKADLIKAAKLEPASREIREQLQNLKECVAAAEHVEKKMVKKQIKGIDTESLRQGPALRGAQGWQGSLPQCYFAIEIDGKLVGQITLELFADKLPKTAANFLDLCSGDKGHHALTRRPLTYEGSSFHRIVDGAFVQGGDFIFGDGTGCESVYGGTFDDEGYHFCHDREGMLSMASSARDRNGSQFFITTAPLPHLDGHHVVFGRVLYGMEIVHQMQKVPVDSKHRPTSRVRILSCGRTQIVQPNEGSRGEQKKDVEI